MRLWVEQAISRVNSGNPGTARTLETVGRPLRIIAAGLAATAGMAVGVTLVVSLYDFNRPLPQVTAGKTQPLLSDTAANAETDKSPGRQNSNGQVNQTGNQAPAPIVRVVVASPYVREATAPLNGITTNRPTDTTLLAYFETSMEKTGSVLPRSAVMAQNSAPVEVAEKQFEPDTQTSQELSQEPSRDTGLRKSQIASAVNLRAGPHNQADVLTVIPTDAVILAQANCEYWCNVVYDGQQGYIYKTFIRR